MTLLFVLARASSHTNALSYLPTCFTCFMGALHMCGADMCGPIMGRLRYVAHKHVWCVYLCTTWYMPLTHAAATHMLHMYKVWPVTMVNTVRRERVNATRIAQRAPLLLRPMGTLPVLALWQRNVSPTAPVQRLKCVVSCRTVFSRTSCACILRDIVALVRARTCLHTRMLSHTCQLASHASWALFTCVARTCVVL